jgi:two-component system response regulator YesN
MQVFSNIVAPLIAGLFFLLYFIYFVITNPSKAAGFRYFIIFLIAISIFSLGRPVQLLTGPHPLPLIIVNIRVFILCAIIAPVIILASDLFNTRRRRRFEVVIISICVLLGLTYVVFNTLGTKSSREIFQFAGITAMDNDTPSGKAPFYGREVTIGVQIAIGLILLGFSGFKLVKLKIGTSLKGLICNKIFMLNSGVVIFAVSFIIGSYFKQWGIYYIASVLSALLFGGSVLMDAKEVHSYYEKLVPFIKEDIIDNVALSELSASKLTEMLRCLGKGRLNTMIVLKIKEARSEILRDLALMDEVMRIVNRCLDTTLGEDRFLTLQLSNDRIVIAVELPSAEEARKNSIIWEALETIKEETVKNLHCTIAIGLGRSYSRIEDLHASYHEALNAQEYAERLEGTSIIHVDNLREKERSSRFYPVKEKEKLLSLIKVGDVENSKAALYSFMSLFKPFIAEKPEVLRFRLYELVGSMIDAAVLGGGDGLKLDERVSSYYKDIDHIKDPEVAEKWLADVVSEIASTVAHVYEKRSKAIIRNARKFIEENYSKDLSYKDVAKEVFVSPSYFLSLFKEETGLTFVDYLTSVRIERAKALLVTSDKPITEIAYEVGFNNANYFSSIFKKIAGITAKEYRTNTVSK